MPGVHTNQKPADEKSSIDFKCKTEIELKEGNQRGRFTETDRKLCTNYTGGSKKRTTNCWFTQEPDEFHIDKDIQIDERKNISLSEIQFINIEEDTVSSGELFHDAKSQCHMDTSFVSSSSMSGNGEITPDTTYQLQKQQTSSAWKECWKEWELRAITTSGYVIGSTLLLNGPMVICLVFDALGKPFPFAVGDIASLLVALQCLINPFIYAYRFKELRQSIKNIFCCRKKQEQNTNNMDIEERDQPTENGRDIKY